MNNKRDLFTLARFVFAMFFLMPLSLDAQNEKDSTLWQLITKDDNEYIGKIKEQQDSLLFFDDRKLGLLKIAQSDVKRLKPVDKNKIKKGKFWGDNPQASRYFFAPNGYGLKKGEGYYQNVMLFLNQVSYGFTDNFTLGIGLVPTFLVSSDATVPVWLTPKFSIPVVKDKFNLGVGMLAGAVLGDGGGSFGIAYGSATVGSRNTNLSVGLGYGMVEGEWSDAPVN